MDELRNMTLLEMHEGLKHREFSACDLLKSHIHAIEHDELNSFVVKSFDTALKQAESVDQKIKNGENINVLSGIPLGVKNLFCTKDIPTDACSSILQGFVPTYESTVTDILIKKGMCIIGKTNMDEFAMGSGNMYSYYGPVKNPWNHKCLPGGSSGGSAAAVASNLCPAALGSDTGGSVRQPAAFCGVVGVKPTYGTCSRWGMIAYSSSLDQAGVLARNVYDAYLVLKNIAQYDKKDSTSLHTQEIILDKNFKLKNKKLAIADDSILQNFSQDVIISYKKAINSLEREGVKIIPISMNFMFNALSDYYTISCAEAFSNLSRYDGILYGMQEKGSSFKEIISKTRSQHFGEEVKTRLLFGSYVLSRKNSDISYTQSCLNRKVLTQYFNHLFTTVDFICTPTTPNVAFSIEGGVQNNESGYTLDDLCTTPFSLAGLPAISIPHQKCSNNMPIGMQIVANKFNEASLFNFALSCEQVLK